MANRYGRHTERNYSLLYLGPQQNQVYITSGACNRYVPIAGLGLGGGGNSYTKVEADTRFEAAGTSYTKAQSDGKYLPYDIDSLPRLS